VNGVDPGKPVVAATWMVVLDGVIDAVSVVWIAVEL